MLLSTRRAAQGKGGKGRKIWKLIAHQELRLERPREKERIPTELGREDVKAQLTQLSLELSREKK